MYLEFIKVGCVNCLVLSEYHFNKSLKTDLLNANLHSKQHSHLVLESFLNLNYFETIWAYLTAAIHQESATGRRALFSQ